MTAILHCGLSNDSFFSHPINFFQFSFGLLFPFSLWTSISGFSLDFYFLFLFELLSPFSFWTFISLLFPFYYGFLFSFFSLGFFSIAVMFWIFFLFCKDLLTTEKVNGTTSFNLDKVMYYLKVSKPQKKYMLS